MLEAIGLSPTESRVYMTLIENPRSSAADVARQCELPARLAARTLATLARRGLASRLPGRQVSYLAVAPDVSLQPMLARREDELLYVRTAIHELTAAFHRSSRHTHPAELVEVVTGAQNIASRAFALQESAQSSVRGIDKPPYVMPSADTNADREYQRLREGIEYRILYDVESARRPGKLADIRASCQQGEKARILTNAPLKLWMVDDAAALIPIRGSGYAIDAAFVIHPSTLLDALVALFELEWRRGVPVRAFTVDGAAAPAAVTPDEPTRALLGLLAAGLTDEAIARTLGVSLRTVQRRIHDLLLELGVTTRFQAGLAARERGWA
ncbi:helix-turn-helix domain-containing protein [Micromonospora sp. CPCC 205371]|nr:helix-turn-helix domain-containing protein [Micromonospora sp. CPCC 205371]